MKERIEQAYRIAVVMAARQLGFEFDEFDDMEDALPLTILSRLQKSRDDQLAALEPFEV